MTTTKLKGIQIFDGTIKSEDIDDALEKEFTKVRVTTGDLTPDFLYNKIVTSGSITVNYIGASGSAQTLVISGSAMGSDTQIQFNDGGSLSGDSGLTYNKNTDSLTVGGDLAINGGDITTTATTFNIVGSNATTVQIAQGATTGVNLGNSAGRNFIAGYTEFNQGLSGSLTRLTDGTSYIIAGANITVTSASNGAITIDSSASGAPTNASYLILPGGSGAGQLTDERTFVASTGLTATDSGANGNYTVAINDSVVATVSGTTFTGATKHNAGLSGSHTKLTDGTSYLIASSPVTITTGSNGAVTIGSTATSMVGGNGSNNNVITADGSGGLVAEGNLNFDGSVFNVTGSIIASNLSASDKVLITSGSSRTISQAANLVYDSTNAYLGIAVATPGRNLNVNTGVRFGQTNYIELVGANSTTWRWVNAGTITTVEHNPHLIFRANSILGFNASNGSTVDAGFTRAAAGIINVSGSAPGAIFRFNAASSPLAAGDLGMNTTSGRPNAYIGGAVKEMAHTAEIAPVTASYVVLSTDATLSNERVLTAGTGISTTDGGAGSTVTLAINDSVVATVSGTTFTGVTKHVAGLSGSHTRLTDGTSAFIAGSGISITTGSSGAVTVAATGGSTIGGGANNIIYRNSSDVVTGSSGLNYDGVSIKVNGNLESVYSNGDEGGEIYLNKPVTNTSITNGVTIDVYQNKLRFFENGGTSRGYYLDITQGITNAGTNLGTMTKTHTGYTNSEHVMYTFGYDTSSTSFATANTVVTLAENQAIWIDAFIVARQTAGSNNRFVYQRQALYYRNSGGSTTQQGSTNSPWTQESDSLADVQFATSTNDIVIQVKNASSNNYSWVGTVRYQIVQTSS